MHTLAEKSDDPRRSSLELTSSSSRGRVKAPANIQPSFKVNTPGDGHEQEANLVAEQVMRFPEPDQGHTCPCGGGCPRCLKAHGHQPPTRAEEAAGTNTVPAVLSSPGEPLDAVTRASMESRFGRDFGQVRVHTGAQAAQSAQALEARAFTVDQDIVFGKDQYAPASTQGRFLLAHELTHVVQQQAARKDNAAVIQRDVRTSIPLYELQNVGGGSLRQVQTSRTMRGLAMPVSYDPATGIFSVTFRLVWIFPHSWTNTRRNAYVQSFEASVRRVWNDRFILSETRAPHRTAHVQIGFDNLVIPQLANGTLEEVQMTDPPAQGRWRMDVRTVNVRENVDRQGAVGAGVVQLGETSMEPRRHTGAELRSSARFVARGPGDNRTYTQAAGPHEFGHMIGLGDEYLEDSGTPVPSAVRGEINARIMNVGEEVTPDAYGPFVAWLSDLTASTWRVGSRVPQTANRPAPPGKP